MTPDHVEIETLSAFADGDLNAVAALRVERHVAECADCRGDLDRIRGLVASAAALPHDVAPPPEAWERIRARTPRAESREPRWWHNGWLAAAAGLVLVAGTATMMMLARPGGNAKAAKVAQMQSATTPAALASLERNYAPTLAELRETFESQRTQLAPSTIRTLERSLAVIDSAIGEARTALEADPGSADLLNLLSSIYQRKVEFLRRATTL